MLLPPEFDPSMPVIDAVEPVRFDTLDTVSG